MTHVAIQEQLDDKTVDWMEKGQRRTILFLENSAEEARRITEF